MDLELTPVQTYKGRRQSVVPMVVKQVTSCQSSTLKLFDIQVQIVCLVGILRNLSRDSMHQVSFEIEDHTGNLTATISAETQQGLEEHLEQIQMNKYFRVFAIFKGADNPVTVLKMFPIDDANAITNHLLNVIHARLAAEGDFKKKLDAALTAGEAMIHALVPQESRYESGKVRDDLQKKVFEIVKSESVFSGVTKGGVLMHFPSYSANRVLNALETLINEGVVYFMQDGCLKPVSDY